MSGTSFAHRPLRAIKRWRLALILAFLSACSGVAPAEEQAVKIVKPPVVVDPDATIREQISLQWMKTERKLWRIAYHPIKGMEGKSAWHVAGTIWWVRLNSPVFKLDELDKQFVYEIDAAALDQNYGVIDFYVYRVPQKVVK